MEICDDYDYTCLISILETISYSSVYFKSFSIKETMLSQTFGVAKNGGVWNIFQIYHKYW